MVHALASLHPPEVQQPQRLVRRTPDARRPQPGGPGQRVARERRRGEARLAVEVDVGLPGGRAGDDQRIRVGEREALELRGDPRVEAIVVVTVEDGAQLRGGVQAHGDRRVA